ncbi:MAG: lysophospholipid acyltransferase family protein [Chromatiaceae bacterium]|nr:lysophospholipid acyltransferase family protein [Chromatiaceae bacterium]
MGNTPGKGPISLDGAPQLTPSCKLNSFIEVVLEKTSGLKYLDSCYKQIPSIIDQRAFLDRVLETFNIRYRLPREEMASIPANGPLVIVANHPFGAIEGVIIGEILCQVRSDVKIMANVPLSRIPELDSLFISVDPYAGEDGAARNITPLKKAVRWVREGGVLVVFPAGDVARFSPKRRAVVDPPWRATVGGLIRMTGAPVMPVYFYGANGMLFQLAGMLHPRARTALLPRELINKANTTITLRVGESIDARRLKAQGSDQRLIDYLRLRTMALKNRAGAALHAAGQTTPIQVDGIAVAEPVPARLLASEVETLGKQCCLARTGNLSVYLADSEQIPWVLREIGRLREITFRATGEGTGQARDLDLYDEYYKHLFVWNNEAGELVGAYRLGLADEIYARFGKKGLYTQSLFRYRGQLLRQLNPAIELGRSFVRQEYQRSFSPLMLLWKGIGRFIADNPRYSVLFGPVSISNEYQTASQQLMVDFLRTTTSDPRLARYVRPRRPFRGRADLECRECSHTLDMDGISDLVTSIEPDNKGVPILLKQYLKLGGKILGFNVDDSFNDALDCLIMLDLRQADHKVLAKYMGSEAAATFLEHADSARLRSA